VPETSIKNNLSHISQAKMPGKSFKINSMTKIPGLPGLTVIFSPKNPQGPEHQTYPRGGYLSPEHDFRKKPADLEDSTDFDIQLNLDFFRNLNLFTDYPNKAEYFKNYGLEELATITEVFIQEKFKFKLAEYTFLSNLNDYLRSQEISTQNDAGTQSQEPSNGFAQVTVKVSSY
jgi:hypothetical protein